MTTVRYDLKGQPDGQGVQEVTVSFQLLPGLTVTQPFLLPHKEAKLLVMVMNPPELLDTFTPPVTPAWFSARTLLRFLLQKLRQPLSMPLAYYTLRFDPRNGGHAVIHKGSPDTGNLLTPKDMELELGLRPFVPESTT